MRYPQLALEIARRVKKIIKERNISVCQFATDCQIDSSTMYDIINAEHNEMDYVLIKICRYGKVNCNEFLDGLENFIIEQEDSCLLK